MNIRRNTVVLFAIAALAACSSTTESGDPNSEPPGETSNTTTVQGALSASSSSESATRAELFFVGESGELESASTTEISADATYEFELDLREELEGERTLLVRAFDDSEAEIGSVVGEKILIATETVKMSPIDAETHVEARLVIDTRISGECEACSIEAIRAFVSAEMAARAESSQGFSEDARAAFVVHTQARAEVLRSEIDQESMSAIEASLDAALVARDESLANASSEEESQAALDAFAEARIAAYLESSVDAELLARAFQAGAAAAEASAHSDSEASADAESVWFRSETDAALFVRSFIESEEFASEESATAVAEAGAKLESELRAASETSAEARASVESAWFEYSTTIREAMTATIEASASAALEGIQSSLETARAAYVQAIGSGEGAVSAQAELFASVHSQTHIDALTGAGMAESEAQAHLSILAHLMVESELPAMPEIGL